VPDDFVTSGRLIGEVSVTPAEPKPGESVLVEVRPPADRSWSETGTPLVRINGVSGARQYLQFARAGKQRVFITAQADGQLERRVVEVQVKSLVEEILGAPRPSALGALEKKKIRRALAELPLLQVGKFADAPYRVALAVGGFRVFPSGLANARPFPKKALEPDLARRLRARELLRAGTLEGGAARGAISASGPPLGPRIAERARTPVRAGLTMRPLLAVGNRLRMLPVEAKPLRRGRQAVRGAIYLEDPALAAALPPPPLRPEVTLYHWDFGDGTSATTLGPRVDHDYRPALDPERECQQFDVTLRIRKPDGTVVEARRTLSVYNAYVMCKKRGVLAPRVEQHVFAQSEGFGFRGRLAVYNVENFPITLTAQRVRVVSEDTERADALTPLTPIAPVTIPAKGSREMSVYVPFSMVPRNAMGFAVHYFGDAPDGKPIRVEAFFDVPARDRASGALRFGDIAIGRLPLVRNLLAAGRAEGEAGSEAPPAAAPPSSLRAVGPVAGVGGRVSAAELNPRVLGNALAHLGRVGERPRLAAEGRGAQPAVAYSLTTAPPPVEGAECDPDNLPDLSQAQQDEGWVCQATPETREVVTPARFLNALKGDIILSPGGNGLIGGLLLQVNPPQRYSHSGIMTRNYDQITHSTASEDRLLDRPNGSVFGEPAPTEGFQPNALKYLWPGVITQSVEQAVYGEDMTDPEGGKTYRIRGFTPTAEGADIAGHWEIIPPLVVKPDPLVETPEIRAKLRQVANDALAQTGNSHYRFFCYTDPTLGQRPEGVAPPTAGWAAGTYPSVCSSFVWMTLKRQAVALESANTSVSPADLEVLDVAAGAQVGSGTPDGLYLYTAAERLQAAEWLKQELERRVARKLEEDAGILADAIDFFSDMADDVANQVLNTFASDWADTAAKDSEKWKDTRDANAVSPDNILLWDSPPVLGLYGYAAPLAFRPARLEEVIIHRWRKVPTRGRLSGRVWYQGAPVPGAFVQVYDGKTDITDGNGAYEITGVPFGHYAVKAWKDNLQGVAVGATVETDITQPAQTLDITLQPPADVYRRVQVQARIQTTDDEVWPWDDEHADTTHFREVFLQPWHTHEEVYFEQRMGGEIRIELRVILDLNMDRSLTANLNAKMYEGTSEDTGDLDDEENCTGFLVGKDQARSGYLRLYNDEFAGGDVSNIHFTITNLVQP